MNNNYGEHFARVHGTLTAIEQGISVLTRAARQQFALHAVLAVETHVFDANGIIARSWHVPYGSVAVDARKATQDIYVTPDGVQNSPPTTGTGVALVPMGKATVINLTGRQLAFYGKAGDAITIQVFAAAQPPAWG